MVAEAMGVVTVVVEVVVVVRVLGWGKLRRWAVDGEISAGRKRLFG